MKRSTVRFIIAAAIVYFAFLYFVRGLLPSDFPVPLYFLVAPLFLLVVVLVVDLTNRVTVPSTIPSRLKPERRVARAVQQLARQIEVGTGASPEYYDRVLLARLRDILVDKVCLETGLEKDKVQETLKNKMLGPALLRDKELYRLLYSGVPSRGSGRLKMLERATAAIEAWKL